jgi:hypothetical protein
VKKEKIIIKRGTTKNEPESSDRYRQEGECFQQGGVGGTFISEQENEKRRNEERRNEERRKKNTHFKTKCLCERSF